VPSVGLPYTGPYRGDRAVMGTPPQHVLDSCACDRQMPVLIIHGTADAIVPYNGEPWDYVLPSVRRREFWAEHNGCGGDRRPRLCRTRIRATVRRSTSSNTRVARRRPYCCTVLMGAATLVGQHRLFGATVVGRVSLDIDASEVIWSFFSTQTAGFQSTAR